MAFATDIEISREDVQTATDTLGLLSRAHQAKFGPTPMNNRLNSALRLLEVAGYVNTFIRDPKQGISEAVSGELVGAMNINPVLFGLNVAGDISIAILPSLHKTAEGLKAHNDETYSEYLESIAVFEVLAAYRRGVSEAARAVGDKVADFSMSFAGFVKEAIVKGDISPTVTKEKQRALLEAAPELGKEFGEALREDPGVKELAAEYSLPIVPVATAPAKLSYGTVSSVRTGPGGFKPSDIKVGLSVFGSTSAGLGAALVVSMPTNPASLAIGALALAGLWVANLLNHKRHKKKKKEFRKKAEEIRLSIEQIANRANEICKSGKPIPEKIVQLQALIVEIESYTRHKGVITNKLDHILGADAAREVGDKFREILRGLQREIRESVIPALTGQQAFIGAVQLIDNNDYAAAARLGEFTEAQREFCQAYIALKRGDESAVARLQALERTECRELSQNLLEQYYSTATRAAGAATTNIWSAPRAAGGAGAASSAYTSTPG